MVADKPVPAVRISSSRTVVRQKNCCFVMPGRANAPGIWPDWRVWLTSFVLLLSTILPAPAQKLQLEIQPQWHDQPIMLNGPLPSQQVNGLTLSRLDGLLSQLALQRLDGSWMES